MSNETRLLKAKSKPTCVKKSQAENDLRSTEVVSVLPQSQHLNFRCVYTIHGAFYPTTEAAEVADIFTVNGIEEVDKDETPTCNCPMTQLLRNAPRLNKDGTCKICGGK